MSIMQIETGHGILRRIEKIRNTPVLDRRARFGRAWACELVNGQQRIEDEFPELVGDMRAILDTPTTLSQLTAVGQSK
jgi:hypothetical protein